MKKTLLSLLITISFFIMISCKGREIKPSVDFLTTQNAIETIKSVIDAYERKDDILIKEKVAPSLSDEILKGIIFKDARLSFSNKMVRITDSEVKVNTNWLGKWIIDGKEISNRGMTTFVLQKEGTILVRIEGDNPFSIPQ